MAWDLWIDFQRGDDDGLTYANVRNLRAGLSLTPGDTIVVGNEDTEPGVAEVVARSSSDDDDASSLSAG